MSLSTTSTHLLNTSRAYSESSLLPGNPPPSQGVYGRGWRCGTSSPMWQVPAHKPILLSSNLGAAAQKGWKGAHFGSLSAGQRVLIPSAPAAQAMQTGLWMKGYYNHWLLALTEDSSLLGANLYPSSLFPSLGNQVSLKLPSWCCWGLVLHLALWTQDIPP